MNFNESEWKYNLLKAQTNYEVLREWIYTMQIGHPIKDFFLKNGYKTIAVYGMGEIGLLFCNELMKCSDLSIVYAIDKYVKSSPLNIPVSDKYLTEAEVDVIVITAQFAEQEIKDEMRILGIKNVFSIKEVIINA